MTTDMKRRIFLKGSMAASAVGIAVGAGLLTPRTVVANWDETAFAAKSVDDAVKAAMGDASMTESDAIKIKAPDIAENGAVVPVSVSASIEGAESIALLSAGNSSPLVAVFSLAGGTLADVSTRIKMGKTSDVIAVVKAGDTLHSARKSVKVTIGGCGG